MHKTTLLNGNMLAKDLQRHIKNKITLRARQGIPTPGLCTILVGNDAASEIYVRNKIRSAQEVGIKSFHHQLPLSTSEQELISLLNKINNDSAINGVLVQLPLPKTMDTLRVNSSMHPDKDVDGFHPINMGKLVLGEPGLIPCTPKGCIALLNAYNISMTGAHAVIVGASNIVGKPLAHLLLLNKATVTLCHVHTKDLAAITKTADILASATGKAHLIGVEHVKQGTVIIDVGVNRQASGKLVGDVDMLAVWDKVSAITPVPGGVGPMTITMLMKNTVMAAKLGAGLMKI